jgi:D-serine deaminase-like pyridoxal phosphate-dependent protein
MPWHVCPTVALHGQAVIVRDGRAVDRWQVTARERMLTV